MSLSVFEEKNELSRVGGLIPSPSVASVYLALFTAAPASGDGSGTEVAGGSYARVQVAGRVTTNGSTTTASPTLQVASPPSWIVAGMLVYDITTSQPIGTVQSVGASTITLQANASNAVGNGDTLSISAFGNPTGGGPANMTNSALIAFATATGSWGTITSFGLYDALTVGDLLWWDYLGNFPWQPCTISNASPGVFTAHAHGFSNNDSIVYSTEFGGTAPTGITAGGTIQTVAGATTDTFNVGINTTATGNGNVRKVTQQSVPSGVQPQFQTANLSLTLA